MLCKFILSRFHLTYKFEPVFLDPFKGILDDFFFFLKKRLNAYQLQIIIHFGMNGIIFFNMIRTVRG
jgi:hypothetical protein